MNTVVTNTSLLTEDRWKLVDKIYEKDIDQLIQDISQRSLDQVAKDFDKAEKLHTISTKWRLTLSIGALLAGIAALVAAVAMGLFSVGIITISSCTKIILGSCVTVITAAGSLYAPITTLIGNMKDYSLLKSDKDQHFDEIDRATTLIINRRKYLKKLEDNTQHQKSLQTQEAKLYKHIIAARDKFPQSALMDERLELSWLIV